MRIELYVFHSDIASHLEPDVVIQRFGGPIVAIAATAQTIPTTPLQPPTFRFQTSNAALPSCQALAPTRGVGNPPTHSVSGPLAHDAVILP
jgi:hypothetical protein